MKYLVYLVDAIDAAVEAGKAVLEVYGTDFGVETKADNSPLTVADMRSHEIIKARLERHGIPSISEEGRHADWETRRDWSLMWVVDPLDGTKEFVKRNGEFTINIARVHGQTPVSGVILVPVKNVLYFADPGTGARKALLTEELTKSFPENPEQAFQALLRMSSALPIAPRAARPYTIAGSRSHSTPELQAFVEKCRLEHGAVEYISVGSSLKFCLVAEATADVYLRTGPTCEWDTAAGQAIAEQAGAVVEDFHSGRPLRYNKEDLHNPWFIVRREAG